MTNENSRYSKEEKQWIKENYSSLGVDECAKVLKRTRGAIHSQAQDIGVKFRIFFDYGSTFKIDIQDKNFIYLLGYWWADGCLRKHVNKYYFEFLIQERDGKEVETLHKDLNIFKITYRPPKQKTWQPMVHFISRNEEFCKFLLDMEFLTKSKSSPIKLLNNIPEKLHYYFWRGFLDGDGCVSSENYRAILFIGDKKLDWFSLENLLKTIDIEYKLYRNKYRSELGIYRKKDVRKIIKYLYPNIINDVGLSRKFERAKRLYERTVV